MRARYGSDATAICRQAFIRTADDEERLKKRRVLQVLLSEDRIERARGTARQPTPIRVESNTAAAMGPKVA